LASIVAPGFTNPVKVAVVFMRQLHKENHLVERIGWLRAAVLGANDGIISTASLILGVASAAATKSDILLSGVAGLVAGAMSWRLGSTFRSTRNQIQNVPILREARELSKNPQFEK
jgi:vacuolar iron transporter family protein